MLSFKKTTSNAVAVLDLLIRRLDIPVTSTSLEENLQNHPDFPSLLALNDVLNLYKVPNQIFKADKDTFDFEQLNLPVLAAVKSDSPQFVLVEKIDQYGATISDEKKLHKVMPIEEFKELWNGYILYAEKNEFSGEPGYKKKLFKERIAQLRWPFFVLVTAMAMGAFLSQTHIVLLNLLLMGVMTIGISVCLLLLTFEIDLTNPIAQRVCQLASPGGCYKILRSSASKITGWLSWSDVGAIYFSGSFLFLLVKPQGFGLLLVLNLLALPFSVYSITYQIKKKEFCVLCSTVQVLLWIEATVLLINRSQFDGAGFLDIKSLLYACLSFLVASSVLALLKPLFRAQKQAEVLHIKFQNLKMNRSVFNALLTSGKRFQIYPDLQPVSVGNINSTTRITIITSPFCQACHALHRLLDEWLEDELDIRIDLIFISKKNSQDEHNRFGNDLYHIYLNEGPNAARAVLKRFVNGEFADFKDWTAQIHKQDNPEVEDILLRQRKWINEQKIAYTPTVLINGYQLPLLYAIGEIRHLLIT